MRFRRVNLYGGQMLDLILALKVYIKFRELLMLDTTEQDALIKHIEFNYKANLNRMDKNE